MLVQAQLPVTVRVTINRHNYRDLDNIARLLLEEIGLPSFSTNEAMAVGSGCRNEAEVALTATERKEVMEAIQRLLERYPGRMQANAGPQAKLKMYAEMERARQTGDTTAAWKMGYLSACGCVFSRIDVLHDGSIVPCHMLPDLVLGNIQTDSLAEIWRSHPTLIAMRKRQQIPTREAPGCETCEWNLYCNGSCPGLARQLTGDMNRANPQDCYQRFLREIA